MKYIKLKNIGVKVSELGLGTSNFSNMPQNVCESIVKTYIENGGNLFDNYEIRGDVVFNIYQKEDSEDYGFTRINEYDLLIHKKFNFQENKNNYIYTIFIIYLSIKFI